MILRLNPAYDMLSYLSPELQPQFISTVVISVVPGFQNEKRKAREGCLLGDTLILSSETGMLISPQVKVVF